MSSKLWQFSGLGYFCHAIPRISPKTRLHPTQHLPVPQDNFEVCFCASQRHVQTRMAYWPALPAGATAPPASLGRSHFTVDEWCYYLVLPFCCPRPGQAQSLRVGMTTCVTGSQHHLPVPGRSQADCLIRIGHHRHVRTREVVSGMAAENIVFGSILFMALATAGTHAGVLPVSLRYQVRLCHSDAQLGHATSLGRPWAISLFALVCRSRHHTSYRVVMNIGVFSMVDHSIKRKIP